MRPTTGRRTFANGVALAFLLLAGSDPRAHGGASPAPPDVVHALFDLAAPTTAPFPSDWFTVPDNSQNTRRRVNVPLPNCAERPSDCQDLAVINTLDGFNSQPRLSIPFDGSISVTTVTSETVFLIRLGRWSCDGDDRGDDWCADSSSDDGAHVIGIDQIVWDPPTKTLHVKSGEFLDQHTRYALIVTRGIRDEDGRDVEPSETFRRFRQIVRGDYQHALVAAMQAARRVGVRERDIVTASVFTTQSTTAILERIRDQVKAATPAPADFLLGPNDTRAVFSLDTLEGPITWTQQIGDDPPRFIDSAVDVSVLRIVPGAVGTIAFGKYHSLDYEVHPGEFIPPIGTRTGTPAVQGANEIYFNLVLPSGPTPPGGWPVAIFGHGLTGNKNAGLIIAAKMAAHGIATIAINAVGHGFGPLGTLTVNTTSGVSVTFSAGGRGVDQNRDHEIAADEGFTAAPPRTIVFLTDGARQTVVDLTQLVGVIGVGVDVDGDGLPDLDPSHIYYVGNSLGGNLGTVFLGIEPSVQVGVFSSAGSPDSENRRLGPGRRPQLGQLLMSRLPPLVNDPGITKFAEVSVASPTFNDNLPLKDSIRLPVELADGTRYDIQSPVTNTVEGAMGIQEVIENLVWVAQSGDAVAYAPYLRKSPLAGMSAKSTIYQFAKGDQTVPNPIMTAILRAGDLADRATYYRHDLAYAEVAGLPTNPHGFILSTGRLAFRPIALEAQEQVAVFFATDGAVIIQPQPARYFEVPIAGALPEDLHYIP